MLILTAMAGLLSFSHLLELAKKVRRGGGRHGKK
jgi:hypothetical protein